MSDWETLTMFDSSEFIGPEPHARMTDPESSDLTVKSLGRDTSYKALVMRAIMTLSAHDELRHYDDGDSIAVLHDWPVTDDEILVVLEKWTGRRHQRNVVARTRGLLRADGWLVRVDDVVGRTGRTTIAHIPSAAGLAAFRQKDSDGT